MSVKVHATGLFQYKSVHVEVECIYYTDCLMLETVKTVKDSSVIVKGTVMGMIVFDVNTFECYCFGDDAGYNIVGVFSLL